jgi:signal peptidase II
MVLNTRDSLWIALLIFVDQLTKVIALITKPSNALFELTFNTGAGFGILQGRNILLILISIAVLALLWKPLVTSKGREHYAYLALVGGILGNFIDRLVHHKVIDFISIGNFPVFNIADSLITVSILYLLATGVRASFRSWNFHTTKKK